MYESVIHQHEINLLFFSKKLCFSTTVGVTRRKNVCALLKEIRSLEFEKLWSCLKESLNYAFRPDLLDFKDLRLHIGVKVPIMSPIYGYTKPLHTI